MRRNIQRIRQEMWQQDGQLGLPRVNRPGLTAVLLFGATGAFAQSQPPAATPTAAPAAAPAATPAELVRRIVVSIPDRKLALMEDGRVVKIYAVAVGASHSPTPTGSFTIITRVAQPNYYAPGVVLPQGPANPVGTRWIGLSVKSFGIHGTNQPRSIGRARSHGCIRMLNSDIEDLFERVRVGDSVELVAEGTDEIASIFSAPVEPVLTAQSADSALAELSARSAQ